MWKRRGLLVGRIVSLPALSVMLKQGGQDSRSDRPRRLGLDWIASMATSAGSETIRPTQREFIERAFDFASGIVTEGRDHAKRGLGEERSDE